MCSETITATFHLTLSRHLRPFLRPRQRPGLVLFLALVICLAACGDSNPGLNHDGGLDASVIPDAAVDNGPLDCGVRPEDGAVCVQGRLYDYGTDTPLAPGQENQIIAFFGAGDIDADLLAVKYSPDSRKGRVDPNGRFFTWTNNLINDKSLTLLDTVSGYVPGTSNVYWIAFTRMNDMAETDLRFYLLSEELLETWQATYTGAAALTSDRPLFIGLCQNHDYSPATTGEIFFDWHLPVSQWLHQELYTIAADRRSILPDPLSLYRFNPNPMPASGAVLFYAFWEYGEESIVGMGSTLVDCGDNHESSIFDVYREAYEGGDVELVFHIAHPPIY